MGFTERSDFYGGGLEKSIYKGEGDCLKRGRLGQFVDLRRGLARKRGEVFLKGGFDTLMPLCCYFLFLFETFQVYFIMSILYKREFLKFYPKSIPILRLYGNAN